MCSEGSMSKQIHVFRSLLHQKGYSKKAIEEICKWFDGSEK
jgi:hypothetical protein